MRKNFFVVKPIFKEVQTLKYITTIFTVISLLLFTGCNNNNNAANDIYPENGRNINVHDEPGMYNPVKTNNAREKEDNYGYVRHQKSPLPTENVAYEDMPDFNREAVADIISRLCVQLPNVDDCATLVTDDEVLIAYQTDSDERFETADQVKRTALSVVPRYFHVYVTDQPTLRKDIENFSTLETDSRNTQRMIDSTVQKMIQSSPQGRDVSTGENENGEAQGELNEQMDNDEINEKVKNNNQS